MAASEHDGVTARLPRQPRSRQFFLMVWHWTNVANGIELLNEERLLRPASSPGTSARIMESWLANYLKSRVQLTEMR